MRNFILSLAILPLAIGTASADIVDSGSGFTIPDNGSNSSVINIAANETITDVTVTLEGLQHTWMGDLQATLTGPGGSIDLFWSVGGGIGDSSDFDGDYTFTDAGPGDLWAVAASLTAAQAVPSGAYFATDGSDIVQSFATAFGGTSTAGAWTLQIADVNTGDTGSVSGWTLSITSNVIPEPASLGLLGVAGLGLAFYRRRK